MGEKEKENEVPAGSIGTDGRNGPENAINKSDPLPSLITYSQKANAHYHADDAAEYNWELL